MSDLRSDAESIDESMISMFQYLKRQAHWSEVLNNAGVKLDRPSAGIVHILINSKSKIRLNDLADKLGVEAPTVTRKTQELEAAGLIKKNRADDDRRSVYIEVTEKGRDLYKKIKIARQKISERALSDWNDADRQNFVSLFAKYINSLNNL